MITAMFNTLLILFTAVYIFLFGAYSLTPESLLFWIAALLLALLTVAFILGLTLFFYGRFQKGDPSKKMRNHRFINSLMWFILRLLRLKVHATGLDNIPKDDPFILVSNHQSNYEILAIKPLIKNQPLVFIAKESIFRWPVLGRLVELLGNIPIKRESDRSAAQSIVKGIKKYKEGHPVVIFPEGTRSKGEKMGAFKAGAFKLATKPKAPILPVAIYNFDKTWQGWPLKRRHVYIHIFPLVPYEAYEDMNTQALSAKIQKTLGTKVEEYEKMLSDG